jgi:fatty acid desaturase
MLPASVDGPRLSSVGSPSAVRAGSGSVAKRLRAQYAREVAALGSHAHSTSEGLAHLGLHIGLGVGAALVGHALLGELPIVGWVLYPLVAFFIATRFRAIGNMLHEACHGMFVRGKRANRSFGHVLAILDYAALDTYTREHFTHHQYLGDPQRDLDFVTRRRFGFAEPTRHFARKHLLRPLLLIHLPTFVRPVLFSRSDPWPVTLCRWAFVAGLLALAHWGTGWEAFLLFYVLPYFVAYQIIRYWSDAMDHAGIIGEADEFQRSRNHILSWGLLNRLLFPRCDQYHLTHHLFPGVPTPFQGRAHTLLMKDPEYAARPHAFSTLM